MSSKKPPVATATKKGKDKKVKVHSGMVGAKSKNNKVRKQSPKGEMSPKNTMRQKNVFHPFGM